MSVCVIGTRDLLDLKGIAAECAWRLAHALDLQIEACQRQGLATRPTLDIIGPWLLETLFATGLLVSYRDALGGWQQLRFGTVDEQLDRLHSSSGAARFADPCHVRVALIVDGEIIGHLCACFELVPADPGGAVLLSVAAQELDNVLYEFRRARSRHHDVLEIERRLKGIVLDKTIDETACFVMEQTCTNGLIVVYADEGSDKTRRHFRIYRDGALIDSGRALGGGLVGEILLESVRPDPEALLRAAEIEPMDVEVLAVETGIREAREDCFLVVNRSSNGSAGAGGELLQFLGVALGQRLVDYHKEQRYLQQSFGPDTVGRLLTEPMYFAKYLQPRVRKAAILFSDITSFTTITEQILDGPEECGEFIDRWSHGVVEILYKYGGTFDKMVGDCVIGLFGPPLDDEEPAEISARALMAAWEINTYTSTMAGAQFIDRIHASPLIKGLGVATGVNYGEVMVGAMGPNLNFTAFGQPMNNTARLQGVATHHEILVMDKVRSVLEEANHPISSQLAWGELLAKDVKNVKDPLNHYRFLWSEHQTLF